MSFLRRRPVRILLDDTLHGHTPATCLRGRRQGIAPIYPAASAIVTEGTIILFMQLNHPAPEFQLPDLGGVLHKLSDSRGRIAVVNFWSAECPYSERADRSILDGLARWGQAVQLLSIAANRNESIQMLADVSRARELSLVLLDADHAVADLYAALTTPHVFVVDAEGLLRYRGAVDDVTFRQRKATRFFLEEAVEALLAGCLPPVQETPAYGCAIVREI